MGHAQPSDAELLARLRRGDDAARAAFERLRERYARPVGQPVVRAADGKGACAHVTRPDAAAPESVPGAALPVGAVPEGLRGEPPDEVDPAERAIVLDAFATLLERARAVLWLTEVEGCPAGDAGTVLGMTPTAAAALAFRAREQLRHAYLRARLHASPQPGCGRPHGSRLAGHVRHGVQDGARTAVAAHLDGCSSCRALVASVGDAPRLFARALVPWSAAPAGTADPTAPAVPARPTASPSAPTRASASRSRPVQAIAGAGRHGRRAAALARGDPALTGTVAVAAALVVAVLAAAFLPGRSPADVAAPRPEPVDERVIVPARPPRPPESGLVPSTTVPGPAPATPSDPAAAAPLRSGPPEPRDTGGDPRSRPLSPQAAAAPTPSPEPTTTVPVEPKVGAPTAPAGDDAVIGLASDVSVPAVSSVVWQPTRSRVEVTLVNAGVSSTGFLVMSLQAAGGALVGAQPTGCALALGMITTGLCALRPLGPGASAVVRVPMTVSRSGQSAEVQVCAVARLRLECTTPLLRPTVVALA